jgi:hypothetical protein
MFFSEIKDFVMYQTNNDSSDLGDYTPYINAYINEGYEELALAWDDTATFVALKEDADTPSLIPDWAHLALAHYATACVYANGNQLKQARGYQYMGKYEKILSRIRLLGGTTGNDEAITTFSNIPT